MKDTNSGIMPDDSRITEMFRAGDETAVSACALKYGTYCRRLAFNLLHSEPDAEECVNDALYAVWRSFPKHGEVCIPALLATVTRRTAIDRYRKNNRASSVKPENVLCIDELYDELHVPGAEQEYLGSETGRVISAFLRGIDRKRRLVFLMRYYESCAPSEIALRMGITVSAVNKSLAKTRKQLKAYLERNGINV